MTSQDPITHTALAQSIKSLPLPLLGRQRSRSPSARGQKTVSFSIPPSSSTESPPAPRTIIGCFCSAIRSITGICSCIGILLSNNYKHPVWVPRAPPTSVRAVSLAELLAQSEPPQVERLKLAVRIATSVLQLHTSDWLQERWGAKDIYLVQLDSSQSSLGTPVIQHDFTSEPSVTKSSIFCCNLSLFSLGVILIELWFWKSLELLQAGGCQERDPDMARYATAAGLIDTVIDRAGAKYGNSVRRCIRGLDHAEPRLENQEFKNKVYLKVLQPLENHLQDFCDKSLEKIFEE